MRNFIEFKDNNNKEYRLEYDQGRIYTKNEQGSIQFVQFGGDDLKKGVDEIKKHFKKMGFNETNSGTYDNGSQPVNGIKFPLHDEVSDILENIFKRPQNKEKKPNPLEKIAMEKMKNEYYKMANNELPKILAGGFLKAMEKYDSKKSTEICCILEFSEKKLDGRMVFVYGDGGECEGADDENVFYKFSCGETLGKCKNAVGMINMLNHTLNLGQESSHWLTDAISLAEEQGAFKDYTITIYGNVGYGEIELDVIYEK